jgi:hypothetical protein
LAATLIAYETETGRVLAIHHFPGEAGDPQSLKQAVVYLTEVAESRITVMSVQPEEIDSERSYTVDHERNALIEVPGGEGGIRFSFEEVQPPS